MAKSAARLKRGDSEPDTGTNLNMGPLGDRLGICLRAAQMQVFREISANFGDTNVTPLLFAILTLIDLNPRCRQSDLGQALNVKQPNLVEKIDTLVQRGLATRSPDPLDRRANVLSLTPAGRRFLADLTRRDEDVCQRFEDHLGADDHATLIRLLKKLARPPG